MVKLDFLKLWQQTLSREIKSRKIKAINSIIFITYRCTSRCSTCNIWKWAEGRLRELKGNELISEKWNKVVEKLYRSDIRSVEIFGGDALLRKDIVYPMVKQCTELGIDTFLPTNSNLMDRETVSMLVSAGLGTIYFSVDGLSELHDNIRGVSGTFNRVKEAICNVYQAKLQFRTETPEIGTITTVSNMNVEKIEELLSDLQSFPLDFVYLQAMGEVTQEDAEHSIIEGIKANPPFVSTTEQTHLLSEKQVNILTKTLKSLRRKRNKMQFHLGLSHIEPLNKETFTKGLFPTFPCHVCTTVVTVTPSGEVVPCPMFTDFVLGSLVKENFLDSIWGNDKHRHFLKKQRNGEFPVCRKCSMRHFYPGFRETFRQVFYPYLHAPSIGEN